jgi:hypothetical protein
MALPVAHHRDRLLVPIKVRPDISPSLAAGTADEPRFQIGKPDVVRPPIRADRNRVAALVVRAIDQDAAHARVAHFGKGDLCWADSHAPIKARSAPVRKFSRCCGSSQARSQTVGGSSRLALRVTRGVTAQT